jgi:hypothetical protein
MILLECAAAFDDSTIRDFASEHKFYQVIPPGIRGLAIMPPDMEFLVS